jgi:NAD(P)-dependent dehydrogenase (short-subunit alcohol dehydrogenase family)
VGERVRGKVAVVTGSTSGIGRGIARRLAAEGASVTISGRNERAGEQAAEDIAREGGRALYVRTDITNEKDCANLIERAVDAFGRLDVLVNNAGIFPRGTLETTTEALWDDVFAVNVRGAFFCCKYAVPHMQKAGGGSIINIGSGNGYCGAPNLLAYAASKGALLTMTRNLARAYARDRIRVNWITTGWVLTEGEIAVHALAGRTQQWLEEEGAKQPFGRLMTPDDIANGALFLASDESEYVSGVELPVAGGPFIHT